MTGWKGGQSSTSRGTEGGRQEADRGWALGWADPHLRFSHMHLEPGTELFTQQNQQAFVDGIMK